MFLGVYLFFLFFSIFKFCPRLVLKKDLSLLADGLIEQRKESALGGRLDR